MFEEGQKVRHIRSGDVVEFIRVSRKHRGVVKVLTTGPWGPLNVDQFESVDDDLPEWTLKTPPQEYLDRFGDDAKNSALARRHVEAS